MMISYEIFFGIDRVYRPQGNSAYDFVICCEVYKNIVLVGVASHKKIRPRELVILSLFRFSMKWIKLNHISTRHITPPSHIYRRETRICTTKWVYATFRLNWASRTSWVWWNDARDTALQTLNSNSSPGGLMLLGDNEIIHNSLLSAKFGTCIQKGSIFQHYRLRQIIVSREHSIILSP